MLICAENEQNLDLDEAILGEIQQNTLKNKKN